MVNCTNSNNVQQVFGGFLVPTIIIKRSLSQESLGALRNAQPNATFAWLHPVSDTTSL